MACFLAPAAAAIVTTAIRKVVRKKEKTVVGGQTAKSAGRWTQRLSWLSTMLWTATILWGLEHVWHGEVVASPPFLTALQTPGALGPMLREIATVGSWMVVGVLTVWGLMVAIDEQRAKVRAMRELESKAED